jgi:uncharacterized membrane protein
MNIKISPLIEMARVSFWFVPSLMVIVCVGLVAGTVWIDSVLSSTHQAAFDVLYTTDIEAARSLLATIAASMVTVTSIALSITIVTLTLASSQFGPRLIRNFMMDLGTQVVLGMFVSTFIYCILIFCVMIFNVPFPFKPSITVLTAIVMTCISVLLLIYFIHNVAKSIQVDVVIDDVYAELTNYINQLFPDRTSANDTKPLNEGQISRIMDEKPQKTSISAIESGYVQLVDRQKLMEVAQDKDLVIALHFTPGDFVVANARIADVNAEDEIEEDVEALIREQLVIGSCRTPVQDPEFAVHQLVEIALRALSPGINDPYTAITCIDKLNSILCCLAAKKFPPKHRFDDNKNLRLILKELSFDDISGAAFDQIREHSENNVAVTCRLLEALHALLKQPNCDIQHGFVGSQATRIKQQQKRQSMSDGDNKVITAKLAELDELLASTAKS